MATDAQLSAWLIERIHCPRCRAAITAMDSAAIAGRLISDVAKDVHRLHVQVAACTAAGHPGVILDSTPSHLDEPPDRDRP
jgi:hypothetical protein